MRPLLTRERLFLPFFPVLCLHHSNVIKLNQDSSSIIGKGRFGTVYTAQILDQNEENQCKKCSKNQKELVKSQVAVKVLKKASVIDNDAAIQIIEEIRIHSVCSGLPHVLPFLKAWQSNRSLYVALDYCQRGSLADLFKKRQSKFSSQSIKIAAVQIHKGLMAIHNLGE